MYVYIKSKVRLEEFRLDLFLQSLFQTFLQFLFQCWQLLFQFFAKVQFFKIPNHLFSSYSKPSLQFFSSTGSQKRTQIEGSAQETFKFKSKYFCLCLLCTFFDEAKVNKLFNLKSTLASDAYCAHSCYLKQSIFDTERSRFKKGAKILQAL